MTNSTQIQGDGFSAEIIRTKRRKTAAIKIQQGRVSVVVPKSASLHYIHTLLTKKAPWIKRKLLLQQQTTELEPKQYISGETFLYLGKNHQLNVIAGNTASTKLSQGRFLVTLPEKNQNPAMIKKRLSQWYLEHANSRLLDKVSFYADIIGIQPSVVKVKYFKARWGSCSIQGVIQFNYLIIMAPAHIIDYVVVHELCHMKQHNHSPAFWQCVEQVLPDYRQSRNWLKQNGHRLHL